MCNFLRISSVKWGWQNYQCHLGISRKLTCSGATWQKFEILSFTACPIGFSLRHTIRSGDSPRPLSSLTLACVGFVLGSPVVRGWTTHKQFWLDIFMCRLQGQKRKRCCQSVILHKFTLNLNYTSYCHLKVTAKNAVSVLTTLNSRMCLVFPPCVYNCCIMDHTYHSHKFFVLPHWHHYVTFPPEWWLPFIQALAFPFWVTRNAPVSPHSAAGSHISV